VPPFPDPKLQYTWDVAKQIAALRDYRGPGHHEVPAKTATELLVATWNLANLGVQARTEADYDLIAEIVGWFDLTTIQEVNDNLAGIQAIHDRLDDSYDLRFSDSSGNRERQAFLWDTTKVTALEEVGRVAIPPSSYRFIKVPTVAEAFTGFDRGPYLATFEAGSFRFTLLSVHLIYGGTSAADLARRQLETLAVAWWADQHHADPNTYAADIIPLGDFNLPKAVPGDPIYDALTARGLAVPPHTSKIGGAIATDNEYDQIAFFPGAVQGRFTGQMNVFDYDGAVFRDLFQTQGLDAFLAYCRFHISDHRPLWASFNIA
jgi:endonuclease/exonuclease/phosphatase family metal-dependent hydrolase